MTTTKLTKEAIEILREELRQKRAERARLSTRIEYLDIVISVLEEGTLPAGRRQRLPVIENPVGRLKRELR